MLYAKCLEMRYKNSLTSMQWSKYRSKLCHRMSFQIFTDSLMRIRIGQKFQRSSIINRVHRNTAAAQIQMYYFMMNVIRRYLLIGSRADNKECMVNQYPLGGKSRVFILNTTYSTRLIPPTHHNRPMPARRAGDRRRQGPAGAGLKPGYFSTP